MLAIWRRLCQFNLSANLRRPSEHRTHNSFNGLKGVFHLTYQAFVGFEPTSLSMVLQTGIEPVTHALSRRCSANWATEVYLKMLDSYPFDWSSQGIHLNTCHSLCPKNVTKKSDSFVSSSTPSFSATRYWEYTLWWTWRDLNALPSACKADALPDELQAHKKGLSLKTAPPRAAVSGNLIAKVLSYSW